MRLRSSGLVAEEQRPLGIVHNPKRKRTNPKPDTPLTAAVELRKLLSDDKHFKKVENANLVHRFEEFLHGDCPELQLVLIPSMDCVPDKLPMLRAATQTLLDFCKTRSQPGRFVEVDDPNIEGHVYQPVGIPIARHLEMVKPAYETLCKLVHLTEDEKVLSNVCSILSCLSDDENYDSAVVIHWNTCQRLVQLLNQDSPLSVVTPALCTLGNIASDGIQSEEQNEGNRA